MNICTIIAKNYVAHARVLAESFHEIHPDGTCSVLVIDDPSGFIVPADEPFEVVTIDEIGLPDPERMAASYDVMELSTAVKPWLLRYLLERPEVDSVIYLDPDIRIFTSLQEVDDRARRQNVVLTPHFTAPLPRDNRKPSEEDILIAGTYNLGFIALGAGQTAHSLLDWWSERLETHCLNDPAQGHFVDQRWIDLAPGLWPGIDVLRDPTFNVAYWNLPTRNLEGSNGDYLVDGLPLRFFHFSGFDPLHPDALSRHQDRIDVAGHPALSHICHEYAGELLDHGFEEVSDWPYGWGEMANGIRFDRGVRRAYRDVIETEEISDSVFSQRGAKRFTEYLTEAENGSAKKSEINRYAKALWDSRADLRQVFPNIEGESGPAYIRWLHDAAADTEVPVELLPAIPPLTNGGIPTPPRVKPGVNIVGYVSSERGVGEAARQSFAALKAKGIPATTIDVPPDPNEMPQLFGSHTDEDRPYDFNLICVNADMLPAVAAGLGNRFFENRHSAGLWFWEVSSFPKRWEGAFKHINEVWVATDHIADALRPQSPVPVVTMRLPILPTAPDNLSRAELGMPEGFCFLFVFDYRSVFRRKNPLGIVQAFCDAFEPGSGTSLVIKSVCGSEFPAERQELAAAVAHRPDIHLIEDTVGAGVKNAMIASCDCYVSLHRSEGLGLTMAEAMYFGRPVIATAYSGNLDFMTDENSYLVPHAMVDIGPGAPPYPPDGEWAEPDLSQAATLMREVVQEPETAVERGRHAAADIRRTHSLHASGKAMAARLSEVKRQRLVARLQPPGSGQRTAPGRDRLEHLLSFGGPPARPGSGQFRTLAKQQFLRLLRPYTSYQAQINASTAESLDELREMTGAIVQMQAESETKLTEIRQVLESTNSKPFMSDDRLGLRIHPVLGETIGFRTKAGTTDGHGYRSFEDVFRGPEKMIRDRQRVYLQLVADHYPVFDAGCGRGEFLDLLKEKGIEFKAIDLDLDMVERCREKGHKNVEHGDLLDALEQTPTGSLGAIFSAQVIEHLPFEHLQRFLELSVSRLQPGGLLIAETVNPHSAAALKSFWVDPTHMHPLFPETMLALCEIAGYAMGDIFAPVGTGNWEADRTRAGEYAIVATAPSGGS